jgi:tRNA dimethylallyltransferase
VAPDSSGFKVVLLAGPTASGKSPLAMALAERWNGVVVNADAMQIYRELRVLTARPSAADEARVPHALYGHVPVARAQSVAEWRAQALAAIGAARDEGRTPILAGGTGFYLKALIDGLADIPPVPPSVRAEARRLAVAMAPAAFHAEVAARDPQAAARIAPGDGQRLARAWEVHEATGRPLSEWQRTKGAPAPFRFLRILLMPPRAALRDAADARLARMVEEGALEEARALSALDPHLPARKAVGLPELLAHVEGRWSLARAVEAAEFATHRYIKRQTTWFRHQMKFDHGFETWGTALAALHARYPHGPRG